MVKQNNSVNKSTSKKACIMRASNHPDVIAEMREEKRARAEKRAKAKAKAKAIAEKKIKKSSSTVKKTFGCCMMRAENDYTLLENHAKGMVCSECKTKSTPLWRKGPKGPKTLCNACGLRSARLEKAASKEDYEKNKHPAGSSSEA